MAFNSSSPLLIQTLSMPSRHPVMDSCSPAGTKSQEDGAALHLRKCMPKSQSWDLHGQHSDHIIQQCMQPWGSSGHPSCITWLNCHAGFSFTTSGGSGLSFPQKPLRCLFSPLLSRDWATAPRTWQVCLCAPYNSDNWYRMHLQHLVPCPFSPTPPCCYSLSSLASCSCMHQI